MPLRKLSFLERAARIAWINLHKKYPIEDYERLIAPYLKHESITHRQFVKQKDLSERKFLLLRHDIDHDPVTAVKMAEWEHARGLRATYCVLHSAWYYGRLNGTSYDRTSHVTEAVRRIHDLGHEISFHNNIVTVALTEGVNPEELLSVELEFLRSLGSPVTGTSSHGDKLCRALHYKNYELFSECIVDRNGGPRTLCYRRHKILLGAHSMYEFGLEYEAYHIHRDVYISDAGGRLRANKRKAAPRGSAPGDRPFVVIILTHPEWWRVS